MKQGNDLQELNCTLKIKDCVRTWLGGGGGNQAPRHALQNPSADRSLNTALPGQGELLSQWERCGTEGGMDASWNLQENTRCREE